jgi:hypothetical protein
MIRAGSGNRPHGQFRQSHLLPSWSEQGLGTHDRGASWQSIRSHVNAWVILYGHLKGSAITAAHVPKWTRNGTEAGVKPVTRRNRRQALQQLYHTL